MDANENLYLTWGAVQGMWIETLTRVHFGYHIETLTGAQRARSLRASSLSRGMWIET